MPSCARTPNFAAVPLDFIQSLDPALFAQAAEDEAISYARIHLRAYVADGELLTPKLRGETRCHTTPQTKFLASSTRHWQKDRPGYRRDEGGRIRTQNHRRGSSSVDHHCVCRPYHLHGGPGQNSQISTRNSISCSPTYPFYGRCSRDRHLFAPGQTAA